MPEDRTEPPIDSRRYCPGGPAVFVNTRHHIAQCPGGCDIWFDTMMDEPVFPPHTVTISTTVTFEPSDG
jgi:hypothetical protein